jgi:hypothetical protein
MRSLCETCASGQTLKGEGGHQRITICRSGHIPIKVPFTVIECDSYRKKGTPSLYAMVDIALKIDPNDKKISGFRKNEEAP